MHGRPPLELCARRARSHKANLVGVLLTRLFDRFTQRPIKSEVFGVCNIRQSQFVNAMTAFLYILLFLQDDLQWRARQHRGGSLT